jgi:hypothetical protein
MFGQITVFLGTSAAIFHRLASAPPLDKWGVRLLAFAGLFVSILFLVLHELVYAYSHGARDRLKKFKNSLI